MLLIYFFNTMIKIKVKKNNKNLNKQIQNNSLIHKRRAIFEKQLDEKFTCEDIIRTLKKMNMRQVDNHGYMAPIRHPKEVK